MASFPFLNVCPIQFHFRGNGSFMNACTKIFLGDRYCHRWTKHRLLETSCVSKMMVYSSIMPQMITQEDFTTLLKCVFIFIILQFKINQETKFMYITSLVTVKNTTNLHQTWNTRTWRFNITQTLRIKTYIQHWYKGAKMSWWSWCGFPKLKIKNSSIRIVLRLHISLTQVLHSTVQ
jgi:hypothetical protein